MFAKLLKQEWRATSKLLGIMSLAVLGVGVLEAVILRMMVANQDIGAASIAINSTLSSLMLFLALAIVAYVIGVQILLIVRFYKNKFTDEGYLTFTLPVTCHQIFLSSLVNMVIWTVISGIVTMLCVGIILVVGTSGLVDTTLWRILWNSVQNVFEFNAELVGNAYWPVMIISAVLGLFSSPVITMTAFTLGAVIAKKHKVLAAFGASYLISMVTSIAQTVLMTFVGMAFMGASQNDATLVLQVAYYMELLIQVAMLVGGYMLSVWLMKNKLNLT